MPGIFSAVHKCGSIDWGKLIVNLIPVVTIRLFWYERLIAIDLVNCHNR